MTHFMKYSGTSIAALVVAAAPLSADVTAAQVWGNWSAYMETFGYEVNAQTSQSGDTLTVNGITLTLPLPEGEGSIRMGGFDLVMVENGDGTVNVELPASIPMNISADPADDDAVDLTMQFIQTGFDMVVSGAPDALTHDFSADSVGLRLTEMVVDGEAMPDGQMEMTMRDVTGQSISEQGDLRNLTQTMAAQSASYVIDFADPEEGGSGRFAGQMSNLTYEGTSQIPEIPDPQNLAQMMAEGLSGSGTFRYTDGSTDFEVEEDGIVTTGQGSSTSTMLTVALGDGHMTYDIRGTGTQFAMSGGEIPFPVEAAMAETRFLIDAPVTETEEPQDFALGVTLGGFTMSDTIWGIFDPAGVLPRDPATVAFDLNGQARMLVDLFDSEQMEAMGMSAEPPAELTALSLSDLTVSAAGAELTGAGDFTFDNSDTATFDGMPRPEGALNLQLAGANGLIDKLIQMGLLPEEQAMGARMMLGMFAVPGEGEDVLTSSIEVNEQGHVLANGQRLR